MSEKLRVQIVQPRSDVEVHLPHGRVLSGPRGAQVGEFLKAVEFPAPVVAAIINDDLHELTYPIDMDARVEPVIHVRSRRRADLSPLVELPAGKRRLPISFQKPS